MRYHHFSSAPNLVNETMGSIIHVILEKDKTSEAKPTGVDFGFRENPHYIQQMENTSLM